MHSKKSLKVFIDGYLLNKEPQGTVTYIRELYKEVAKANKQTSFYIAIFKNESIIKDFSNLENIHFIFFKQESRWLRMLHEIPQLIKKYKFDYAHFQYVTPIFRSKRCKYIVTIHDILFNEFPNYFTPMYRIKRNFLFRISARKADFLLTVSPYSKKTIAQKYRIPKEKILITANGVNEAYFKEYSKEKAIEHIYTKYGIRNFILYVSRVEPRKNQELLLHSFFKLNLHKEGFELIFIGKNTISNNAFENRLNALTVLEKTKVHYLEEIDQEDLIYFYRAAQVFVFPSKAEGFGIPPVEAAALETPVLCSKATAMSDFNFFNPYIFDPYNQQLFEQLLLKIIKEKGKIDVKRIKDEIRKKYSWKESAEVITNIIHT